MQTASALDKSTYIEALGAAILLRHKCRPFHRASIFVAVETADYDTVWQGAVELFGIAGHERAKNCYAWQYTGPNGKGKILTVLGNEFINSAKRAVEAAIFADVQSSHAIYANRVERFKTQLQDLDKMIQAAQINTEDLAAVIQALAETGAKINSRRSHKTPTVL